MRPGPQAILGRGRRIESGRPQIDIGDASNVGCRVLNTSLAERFVAAVRGGAAHLWRSLAVCARTGAVQRMASGVQWAAGRNDPTAEEESR